MGIRANYLATSRALLDRLQGLDAEDLFDEVKGLEEDADCESFDADKLWDGLQFLLTGVSAGEPLEGDALSEALASSYRSTGWRP